MWNAKGMEKKSAMWKRTENSVMTVRGYCKGDWGTRLQENPQ